MMGAVLFCLYEYDTPNQQSTSCLPTLFIESEGERDGVDE